MSTLKVDAIVDKDSGNTTTINGTTIGPNLSINSHNTQGKNLIINGNMRVAQRGTGPVPDGGYHTVDRWRNANSTNEFAFTQAQVTDVPSGQGYSNSFKFTVTTPETSLDGSDYVSIYHAVEAQDLQTLCYGTSSAKTTTLSFWVKSSITGTYAVSIFGNDASRHIVPTYTISSANTWEKKIIQIPGDTVGTINNDNGHGWQFYWLLGSGSTYTSGSGANSAWAAYANGNFAKGHTTDWAENNGATFFLTGVQLELGDAATEFEHESYGQTLSKCQRYFFQESTNADNIGGKLGVASGSGTVVVSQSMPVQMRAKPSVSLTNANIRIGDTVSQGFSTSSGTIAINSYSGSASVTYVYGGFTGLTSYRTYLVEPRTSDGSIGIIQFYAEL